MSTVLFVTTNGTGLGHVTRSMAIARRLPPGLTPIIFTLSKALPTVREQGFYAEYFASRKASGLRGGAWNIRVAARLLALLEEYRPAVVVFDGTFPYRGIRYVIETHRRPVWVWVRRPMWQPGAGTRQLEFSHLFDIVLEPGEFAGDADEGATVGLREQAVRVAPIVFCDENELLPREQAEAKLGLEPGRTHVLIQLGEVPEYQRNFLMESCANLILQSPRADVAILESAISESLDLPPEVHKLSATYPIAPLYRAFDFIVSAAGYNSYHELIGFKIPAAFFPVPKPLDNQAARARYAEEVGAGVEIGLDTTRAINILMSASERERITSQAAELRFPNGAEAAAEAIGRLASSPEIPPDMPSPARSAATIRPDAETLEIGEAVRSASDSGNSRIRLSAATADDLSAISGIGSSTARKILEFRDRRGGVLSIDELDHVEGIGPATMEVLRDRLQP